MNEVQESAYKLIKSDANWINAICSLLRNKKISSNYMCMAVPYFALFVLESEQWAMKMKLNLPIMTDEEKTYYKSIRSSNKMYEQNYNDVLKSVENKFIEHDEYFYKIRTTFSKISGKYYNVGLDFCNGKICGNTVLCGIYRPTLLLSSYEPNYIKNISIIVGKLTGLFLDDQSQLYCINETVRTSNQDISATDLFNNTYSIGENLCLFNIKCQINFLIIFLENIFLFEIPQKLKFSYLLYYYLCDFIKDLTVNLKVCLSIDRALYNRNFRNCIAHYGLGQFMTAEDLIEDDLLFGLTKKTFDKTYFEVKKFIYSQLRSVEKQISKLI